MATLFSKLQYKSSAEILLLNAPAEFQPHLAEIGDAVRIDTTLTGEERYDFAIVFVKSCAQVAEFAAPVVEHMNDDALLWFAYPKKSSKKYKTDLSRDGGWQPLGQLGYEGVRLVAIDADWSALRVRHVSKIKSMTRNFAMSEEGKRRTAQGNSGE